MKNEKKGNIQGSLADFFELPKDVILDLSRLTIIGNKQLYLENHKGIIEYGEERIKIKTSNGVLIIKGKNFTIRNLYAEELYVEGEISSIEIEG